MTSKNNRTPLLFYVKLCVSFQIYLWIQTGVNGNALFGSKLGFFVPRDLAIWWITLENSRAPLLYYVKFCASFEYLVWIQNVVTVRKRPILGNIGDFFVPCVLEIWWMTLKNNMAPLLYHVNLCASLQSRQFGLKSAIFLSYVTLEIWRMTLKNNIVPLLWCFKLCASLHSHHCIQAVDTFRKRPIWVKMDDFLSRVTFEFVGWPWKSIGRLS